MRLFLSLFLALICSTGTLFAEDVQPQRGTLPDGTPFRVDAQGNQIVDYIAELEAAVDNLNRRIHGLESDLESKQGTIERLEARAADAGQPAKSDGQIREKNLVNTASAVSTFDGVNPSANDERLKNLEAQLVRTQAQLESTQRQLEQSQLQQRQLAQGQMAAKSQGGELEALYQKALARQSELETQLNQVSIENRAALSARDAEISRLNMVLTDRDISIQKLKSELIQTESVAPRVVAPAAANTAQLKIPEPSNARATQLTSVAPILADNENVAKASASTQSPVLAVPTKNAANSTAREEPRASYVAPQLSVARERAVTEIKAGLIAEINQLKGLITKRSDLFNEYSKLPAVRVKFTLSRLQSSRGYTLVTITDKIKSSQRIGELAELSRDIDQIRRRVRDDIDLIERMMKI